MFCVILGCFWNTLVVWGLVELRGVATALNDIRLHTEIPVKKVVKAATSCLVPSHLPQLPPDANWETQGALAPLPLTVLLTMFSSQCQPLSPPQLSFPERHSPCSLKAKVRLQTVWENLEKGNIPGVVYRALKSWLDHIPEQRSHDEKVKCSGTQVFRGHGIPARSLMGVIPSVQAFKHYLKYILIMFPSLHSSQVLFTSIPIQLYAFSLKTNQQEILKMSKEPN